jgi:hypothetical protein
MRSFLQRNDGAKLGNESTVVLATALFVRKHRGVSSPAQVGVIGAKAVGTNHVIRTHYLIALPY